MMVVLVAAAVLTISSTALSNISQVWASTSSQTSCVNNQPCHTVVCNESQPCKVSETPNTDFEFDADETDSIQQPLEGETIQQPLEGTETMGPAPFSGPYNNGYSEDQEEYLEERQDMMEDAEYE
jgi:exo-beta-1,3-glucanase (GH17 family)